MRPKAALPPVSAKAMTAYLLMYSEGLAANGRHSRDEASAADLNAEIRSEWGGGSSRPSRTNSRLRRVELSRMLTSADGHWLATGSALNVIPAMNAVPALNAIPSLNVVPALIAGSALAAATAITARSAVTSATFASAASIAAADYRSNGSQLNANKRPFRNGSLFIGLVEPLHNRMFANDGTDTDMQARAGKAAMEARSLSQYIVNRVQTGQLQLQHFSGAAGLSEREDVSLRNTGQLVSRQQMALSDAVADIEAGLIERVTFGVARADQSSRLGVGRANVLDRIDNAARLDQGREQANVLDHGDQSSRLGVGRANARDRVDHSARMGRQQANGLTVGVQLQPVLHLPTAAQLGAAGQGQLYAAPLPLGRLSQSRIALPPVASDSAATPWQPSAMLPGRLPPSGAEPPLSVRGSVPAHLQQPVPPLVHPAAEERQRPDGSDTRPADTGRIRAEGGTRSVAATNTVGSGTDPFAQTAAQRNGPSWTDADLKRLTDQVYRMLERKLKVAKERRGL
jgi:hypothetical protein